VRRSRQLGSLPRRRVRAHTAGATALAAALLPFCVAAAEPERANGVPLPVQDERPPRAVFHEGRDLALAVLPEKGEGYLSLARRLCGDERRSAALTAANRGMPLVVGREVIVPWDLLREEYRYLALRAVFPDDGFADGAWVHRPRRARALNHGEGLWQVALWFTGRGESWQEIALANRLGTPSVSDVEAVRIPEGLLLERFRPQQKSDDGLVEFGEDQRGRFAFYRLRKGEALYSAVVLRFTGLTDPEDVNQAAEEIAARSGIDDLRDIPVGFTVKVPFEMLTVAHLPRNEPRRVMALINASELESIDAEVRPASGSLASIHVILDPGHGGEDLGASRHRIWESDYLYDVACRMKRTLERETAATVHVLLRDTEHGCKVFDAKKLTANKKEVVSTNPPHRSSGGRSTRVGVNLRWYLANSIYRRLTKEQKISRDKIVFISLHADSLHSELRGAMIYVPGARYRAGSQSGYGKSHYKKYKEWKQGPSVSFSRKERLRDEVVSRKLAAAILESYASENLPVHLNRPIRDHVVRGRSRGRPKRWLPAVLRGNMVPAKVLVETLNINNERDARILADPDGRERIAGAIVLGLRRYFGDDAAPPLRRAGAAADEPRSDSDPTGKTEATR